MSTLGFTDLSQEKLGHFVFYKSVTNALWESVKGLQKLWGALWMPDFIAKNSVCLATLNWPLYLILLELAQKTLYSRPVNNFLWKWQRWCLSLQKLFKSTSKPGFKHWINFSLIKTKTLEFSSFNLIFFFFAASCSFVVCINCN